MKKIETDGLSKLRWLIILTNLQLRKDSISYKDIDKKFIGFQPKDQYTSQKVSLLKYWKIIKNLKHLILDLKYFNYSECFLLIEPKSIHKDKYDPFVDWLKERNEVRTISVVGPDKILSVGIVYADDTHRDFVIRNISENPNIESIQVLDVLKTTTKPNVPLLN